MAVSAAKLAANRRNALKSTGPKSLEGKQKVRGNALTHGLSALAVRTPEDQHRTDQRVVEWVNDLRPDNKTELSLVTIAAEASVRLESALTLEADVFTHHLNGAIDRFTVDRQAVVQDLLQDPSQSLSDKLTVLRDLAYGCDWLIGQWLDLKTCLESEPDGDTKPGWTLDQLHLALSLLGVDPQSLQQPDASLPRRDRVSGILLALDFALCPDRPYSAALAEHLRIPDLTPEMALTSLLHLINAERAKLEARQQELWLDVEQPAFAPKRVAAALKAAKEALIFKRYQSSAASDMHRLLDRMAKLRKELSRPRESAPRPVSQNKANVAATPEPSITSVATPSQNQRPPAPPRTAPPAVLEPLDDPLFIEAPEIPHNRHDTNLARPLS